uniref:GNAT family N-acetyltransferase n=1 Tax=Lysinibacillus sp. D3C2_S12 TaxID=2941226 RepID=UPI0020C16C5C
VVYGYKPSKARHFASIRLAVKEEHQQKGIGSALMQAVENWSQQRDISRLELTVMEHNNVALHLFKKLGFQQEGIRQYAIKLNNTFVNE